MCGSEMSQPPANPYIPPRVQDSGPVYMFDDDQPPDLDSNPEASLGAALGDHWVCKVLTENIIFWL